MWNFFGSSQLANFLSLLALIVAWASTRRQNEMVAVSRVGWTRRRIIFGILAIVLYGYAFYRTHQIQTSLQECQARPLLGFGTQNDRLWAQVNTKALEIRANGKPYNAIFVARLSDKTIDENTDRTMLKSYFVPIPDEVPMTRNMEVVLSPEIVQRLPIANGLMDARLYLLPMDVSRDMISCLADIKSHQGRLIAGGWYTIPYTLTSISDAHKNKVSKTH